MPDISYLELEPEIEKIAGAMMVRNRQVGKDLITNLRIRLTLKDVAGVVLVSLERIVWFDVDAFVWAIANLIPTDVMQEIQSITSVAIYQQLINKGFTPGKDYSMDANSKLLLNSKAKSAIFQ